MMNRLRNSASPASTWLGGVCCRPSALRVRPSTTKILVKLVQVSRIAGSSESRVSPISTVTEVLGLVGEAVEVDGPSRHVPVGREPPARRAPSAAWASRVLGAAATDWRRTG